MSQQWPWCAVGALLKNRLDSRDSGHLPKPLVAGSIPAGGAQFCLRGPVGFATGPRSVLAFEFVT